MINAGFVDYVVTVNFDNLVQRSLSLYDIFPSVHDLTNLKEKVTDTIESPAVIHVHGQYNGNWQLNKIGELGKVKEMMQNIFAKISQNRTWIVVGYSGEDPVFDTVFSSTKFDKNLYWVCYKDQAPSQTVQEKLLNKTEYNACRLNGYDADSFFMKLHNELAIEEPNIYKNPFTVLETYLANIKDISGDEFKGVNQRLEISKKRVKEAIALYNADEENTNPFSDEYKSAITRDNYALKLSEMVSSKNFDKIPKLHDEIKQNKLEDDLKTNLSDAYFSWGFELGELADYNAAIEKYKTALEFNPNTDGALHNWGIMLYNLRDYAQAVEKIEQAIALYSEDALYYRSMGISLYMLKDYDNANLNFKKAIDLNANDAITYLDFANSLAKQESYKDAVKKYQKAIELDPLLASAYSGLGHCLNRLDKLDEALIQLQKGESIKEGSCLYNLACGYALTNQKELCLAALEKLLKNELLYNESVTRDELENDPDFKNVKDLPGFIKLLDTYKPTKG
jgi:tetratricopeptide (TPR) repeat protein